MPPERSESPSSAPERVVPPRDERSTGAHALTLSADDRERFERDGWIGPFAALPPPQARALAPVLETAFRKTRGFLYPDRAEMEYVYGRGGSYYDEGLWAQSLHVVAPDVVEVAQRPEILDRVAQLIGNDVMLWGSIHFAQEPAHRLHWHSDIEWQSATGVALWMGVRDATPHNALQLIPGSHRFPRSPGDLWESGEANRGALRDDERVLEFARQWHDHAEIVRPPISEGQFILFDGRIWHASENPGALRRHALGLRFSPPSQKIRIEMAGTEPAVWDPAPVPTVMLKGEDRHGLNAPLPDEPFLAPATSSQNQAPGSFLVGGPDAAGARGRVGRLASRLKRLVKRFAPAPYQLLRRWVGRF